jgi:hypothetical protein
MDRRLNLREFFTTVEGAFATAAGIVEIVNEGVNLDYSRLPGAIDKTSELYNHLLSYKVNSAFFNVSDEHSSKAYGLIMDVLTDLIGFYGSVDELQNSLGEIVDKDISYVKSALNKNLRGFKKLGKGLLKPSYGIDDLKTLSMNDLLDYKSCFEIN